jgi:hypothetical protein
MLRFQKLYSSLQKFIYPIDLYDSKFVNQRGWIEEAGGIVTYMSVIIEGGFGLDIEFIDNLQVVTTNNYNAISNFHTLHITRAQAKSFPARNVFIISCLVTAPNSGDTSSVLTALLAGDGFVRLAVYCHSVRLGEKTLYMTSNFFQLNTFIYNPYVTSSLTRRWVCLL